MQTAKPLTAAQVADMLGIATIKKGIKWAYLI